MPTAISSTASLAATLRENKFGSEVAASRKKAQDDQARVEGEWAVISQHRYDLPERQALISTQN